jgi:hypothetical protein
MMGVCRKKNEKVALYLMENKIVATGKTLDYA